MFIGIYVYGWGRLAAPARSDTTARSSTVPTSELNGRRERCHQRPARFTVRSTPWQASPLGRPRIGWGAEGLIIEQSAAEAVGLLPMLDRSGVTTSCVSSIS
jgi:hypothetical protein